MPSKLAVDVFRFLGEVETFNTPQEILDRLGEIAWSSCRAHVLRAALLPLNFGTTDSLVLGKTVFLHRSAPRGWWEERVELSVRRRRQMTSQRA
jgi:hypothetical protein